MPTYTEMYDLAIDPIFQSKVRVAATTAAINILAEERGHGFDTYYDKRHGLANTVLGTAPPTGAAMAGGDVISRFSMAVASNVAINADSSDSDIQFTINSMWDSLAGIEADEKP